MPKTYGDYINAIDLIQQSREETFGSSVDKIIENLAFYKANKGVDFFGTEYFDAISNLNNVRFALDIRKGSSANEIEAEDTKAADDAILQYQEALFNIIEMIPPIGDDPQNVRTFNKVNPFYGEAVKAFRQLHTMMETFGIQNEEFENKYKEYSEKIESRIDDDFMATKSHFMLAPSAQNKLMYLSEMMALTEAQDDPEKLRSFETFFYRELAKDEELCALAVKVAQHQLDDYASGKSDDTPEKTDINIRISVETICIGTRFLDEMKNGKNYNNEKLPQGLRDMSRPALEIGDALSNVEVNDYKKETQALLPDDLGDPDNAEFYKEQGLSQADVLSANIDSFVNGMKEAVGYKSEDASLEQLAKKASGYDSKLGSFALEEGTGNFKNVRALGSDTSVKLDTKAFKAISGNGSPEYMEMHNAYADYCAKSRFPGSDCSEDIKNIFEASKDYLLKKDTVPFTKEGKARVEAANSLMAQAGMKMLMDEKVGAAEKETILYDLKTQMARSPYIRETLMRACTKEYYAQTGNKYSDNLLCCCSSAEWYAYNPKFAKDKYAKNGIYVEGKVIENNVTNKRKSGDLSNWVYTFSSQNVLSEEAMSHKELNKLPDGAMSYKELMDTSIRQYNEIKIYVQKKDPIPTQPEKAVNNPISL